jgi:hypothetical protein
MTEELVPAGILSVAFNPQVAKKEDKRVRVKEIDRGLLSGTADVLLVPQVTSKQRET